MPTKLRKNEQGGHGSVRLRFVHGMVPAVPVFGFDFFRGKVPTSMERVSRYFSKALTARHGSGFGS